MELAGNEQIAWSSLAAAFPWMASLSPRVIEQLRTDARYAGYLHRQQAELRLSQREDGVSLDGIVFDDIGGLSTEMREKLNRARPETLGSAARIQGITPAALAAIAAHLRKRPWRWPRDAGAEWESAGGDVVNGRCKTIPIRRDSCVGAGAGIGVCERKHGGGRFAAFTEGSGGHGVVVSRRRWDIGCSMIWFTARMSGRFARCETERQTTGTFEPTEIGKHQCCPAASLWPRPVPATLPQQLRALRNLPIGRAAAVSVVSFAERKGPQTSICRTGQPRVEPSQNVPFGNHNGADGFTLTLIPC